eukprot:CAMPEP_0114583456 /NCGR_PEP_ID=MMETSP0125-20121206/7175_1 /TAXON_ID=485358 ORGANISM="Aristerostoma sp., Strain ATCC 50986" /NCGR_SAMPLE_ID=MMETSP0125 /ASSEMBLY_ACC=CAM_ASM_000245 /LENGTH=89 /DNA_ID=CAMNT_0001776903 /DNA_START=98 /DNA_END=364 /DNA_ORIENTATION=+
MLEDFDFIPSNTGYVDNEVDGKVSIEDIDALFARVQGKDELVSNEPKIVKANGRSKYTWTYKNGAKLEYCLDEEEYGSYIIYGDGGFAW